MRKLISILFLFIFALDCFGAGLTVSSFNGVATNLTRYVTSTNLAISQPSAGTTNVEAINSHGAEFSIPFADFSGGGSGDFGFTNGINTNAPVGVYVYDTNHFGIGTNSPVGNKPFGSASTNNTGDFDTNGAAAASSIITSNALVSTINVLPYTIKLSSTNGIFTPTSNGSGQTNWTFTLTNTAGLSASYYAKTFTSTNVSYVFTVNADGSTNVQITITNLPVVLVTNIVDQNYVRLIDTRGHTNSGVFSIDAANADTNIYGGLLGILPLKVQEGSGGSASALYSHSEGSSTFALGSPSHSEGSATTALMSNSHAEGNGTEAGGLQSHAEGNGTLATGSNSHAEGNGTTASGSNSHAEGFSTTASSLNSHAEGNNTVASGTNSFAGGNNASATQNNSYAWSDGTALISPTNNSYSVTATNGIYLNGGTTGIVGNAASLTNMPISGLNTNGGSAGQVATISGGNVIWAAPSSGTVTGATLAFANNNETGVVTTANGSIAITLGLTNTPTLTGPNTFTGANQFNGGTTLTNTGGGFAATVNGDQTNNGDLWMAWNGVQGYGGIHLVSSLSAILTGGFFEFQTARSAAIANEITSLNPNMFFMPCDVSSGMIWAGQPNSADWVLQVFQTDVDNAGTGHFTNGPYPAGNLELGINSHGQLILQNQENAINGGDGTTNGFLLMKTSTTSGTTNTSDYMFKNGGTYFEEGFSQDSGDTNFLGNTPKITGTNGAVTQFPLSVYNAGNAINSFFLSAMPTGMTNLFTFSTNQFYCNNAPNALANGIYTYAGSIYTNGVASGFGSCFTNTTGCQGFVNANAYGLLPSGVNNNKFCIGFTNAFATANNSNAWYRTGGAILPTAAVITFTTSFASDGTGGYANLYGDTLPTAGPVISALNTATAMPLGITTNLQFSDGGIGTSNTLYWTNGLLEKVTNP